MLRAAFQSGAARRRFLWAMLALLAAYAAVLSSRYFLAYGWKPHRVETAWFIFTGAALLVVLGRCRMAAALPANAAPSHGVRNDAVAIAALCALTAGLYSAALSVGFLSDDFTLLALRTDAVGWRSGATQFVRPVPLWTMRLIDRATPAHSAAALHALNISLHLVNGVLVWHIARRLDLSRGGALAAASLFLVFPGSAEAVVWCAGLQDVLMTTAALGCVLAAVGAGHPAVLLACVGVALLSKESGVAAPFIAALLAWSAGAHGRIRTRGALYTAAACAALFAVWRAQHAGSEYLAAPSRYLLKTIVSMTFGTLAVPWTADELRRFPALGMAASLIAAGVVLLLVRQASAAPRRARVALALTAWVVFAVAPVYSALFVAPSLEGSRHLYFASAGWALLVASAGWHGAGRAGGALRAAAIALAAAWAVSTFVHVRPWTEAAAERDRILAAAAALPLGTCGSMEFQGLTDTTRGAYVFRNGFGDAISRAQSPAGPPNGRACRFRWNGTTFSAD